MQVTFWSEGFGERICSRCKGSAVWRSAITRAADRAGGARAAGRHRSHRCHPSRLRTRPCIGIRTEVSLGPHRLMLRPRETRDLSLTSFDLEISPEARIDWSHDVAGNAVATAQFDAEHDDAFDPVARARGPARPVWPVFPIAAAAASYPFVYSPTIGPISAPWPAAICGRCGAAVSLGRANSSWGGQPTRFRC
jgi:hypothetical protein